MEPQSTDPKAGGPLPTIAAGETVPEVGITVASGAETEAGGPLPTIGPAQSIGATGTAPPAGAGSSDDDAGLQPMLRSRLIFVGTVALLGWVAYALGMIASIAGGTWSGDALLRFVQSAGVSAIQALILFAIVRDRGMPVGRLRAMELAFLTLLVGMDVCDTITDAATARPEVIRAGTEFANSCQDPLGVPHRHLRRPGPQHGAPGRDGRGGHGRHGDDRHGRIVVPTAGAPGLYVRWIGNMVGGTLGVAGVYAPKVFNSARINAYRREAASARKVGNYLLVHRLGGGGMGEVFLARHRLLKRPCAIKLIRPERAADATFASRFEREVAATTRLNHPGAVQVYDYGRTDDGHFYYVMEYLPGLTLDEVIAADGPMPAARVVHLLRQVCGALRAAHLVGLVHRDVKPGNIMACRFEDRTDVAKLLDFGLVADAETAEDQRLTQVGGILGTPAYMSPEQARGEPHVGPSSDLYSLGAVAYFLLTGRPPFQGRGGLDVLNAHLTAAVVPPSATRLDVPPDLEAVVLKLLAKDPADRFSDAEALDRALSACRGLIAWTEADAAGWWERRTNGPEHDRSAPMPTVDPVAAGITDEASGR